MRTVARHKPRSQLKKTDFLTIAEYYMKERMCMWPVSSIFQITNFNVIETMKVGRCHMPEFTMLKWVPD